MEDSIKLSEEVLEMQDLGLFDFVREENSKLLAEILEECFIREEIEELLESNENILKFFKKLFKSQTSSTDEILTIELDKLEINYDKIAIDLSTSLADIKSDSIPKNLIVTSVNTEVFTESQRRQEFENLFLNYDNECKFCYFRVFKRCSLTFKKPINAVKSRIHLDGIIFMGEPLKMFLSNPIKLKNTRSTLLPPENQKTFLISPPSSPPVGWEQIIEDPPVVNLDLLAILSTKLNPLEPCELIKSNDDIPGIIIHPCVDSQQFFEENTNIKRKFMPTKRPVNDC